MAHAFKAANQRVEIVGVGVATRDHAVPLERAARVLHELQDDKGVPLTGKELEEAARAFAEHRALKVVSIPKAEAERQMEPAITAAETAATPEREVKE